MSPHHRLAATALALCFIATSVSASRAAELRPPTYPEIPALRNGCHVSTLAYLHRFRAAHPAERTEVVRILRRNEAGLGASHSIALFSWRGSWWCRDDILGLAALERPVRDGDDLDALAAHAEAVLDRIERRAHRRAARDRRSAAATVTAESSGDRLDELARAAAILPVSATVFWMGAGNDATAVLFYRSEPGSIAVYEPSAGSFTARTPEANDLEVVRAVAKELGFSPDSVRTDATDPLASAARLAVRR